VDRDGVLDGKRMEAVDLRHIRELHISGFEKTKPDECTLAAAGYR
jgi:hypothetical protein